MLESFVKDFVLACFPQGSPCGFTVGDYNSVNPNDLV